MSEEKPLDLSSDPDFMADLPSEINLWLEDAIKFDDLTKEGKNEARKLLAEMQRNYEAWKKKEGKK